MNQFLIKLSKIFYYETVEKAIPTLNKILKPGDTVLLKGSRANGLEKIISAVRF